MLSKILVTGGCGYIGSHAALLLSMAGYQVYVIDNLSNGSHVSINRVEAICRAKIEFFNIDIRCLNDAESVFKQHSFEAVLHFAGLKSVGESLVAPLAYYDNNFCGTVNLIKLMQRYGVKKLVFSSSANVYGDPKEIPVSENCPTGSLTNPYGRSKLMIEEMLKDVAKSDSTWKIALLRYFNPVGAHESGLIGEDPGGIPNNLVPYITQVAVGNIEHLNVYGDDYPTHDGTGVRDYIHVMDLAEGHLAALNALKSLSGVHTWNLGTGVGYSVLDMIHAFERVCGKPIPYLIQPRRDGDLAISYANPKKAELELGWKTKRKLDEMARDAWRWQKKNPNGFKTI